ncbi:MAG: ATP-binding protein, partial [Microscillaceae bacterium]|nr:ATP-binding protein [Microscillaceae bacterium]
KIGLSIPISNSLHKASAEAIAVISEAKKDLPLIVNKVPESAMALFEYKYIQRVLENLLSNAVKYTPKAEEGGKVIIKASPLSPEEGGTGTLPGSEGWAEGGLQLCVIDNGQGIPKEKFEEIFLPFTNPDAKSLGSAKSVGIGLTFCKTIVEAHGSRIGIASEVGKGSTFYFDLPAPLASESSPKEKGDKGWAGGFSLMQKKPIYSLLWHKSKHLPKIYRIGSSANCSKA